MPTNFGPAATAVSIALVILPLTPSTSLAECTTSGTTATCTGSVGAVSYTDGSITTVDISSLSADISGDTAVDLEYVGDVISDTTSIDGADLEVAATLDSNTNIEGTSFGVVVISSGSLGEDGEDKSNSASHTTGNAGESGGIGGTATFVLTGDSELTASGMAVKIESTGGDGGNGGKADTDNVLGSARGGDGGTGGSADTVTFTMSGSQTIVVSNGANTGVFLSSTGGDGGDGGKGEADDSSSGGTGEDGGDGGDVFLDAAAATSTISTTGDGFHGVYAESIAGQGGTGGDSESGSSSDGGDGGIGGTGGTVTVNLDADITTDGDKALGVYARSYGGSSGDGGNGKSVFDGHDGSAKDASPGGSVAIDFSGSVTTEGSESNAIFGHSVGGFAGDAGSGSGFVTYGANGGSGGSAGAVTITVGDGGSLTTAGDTAYGIDALSVGGGGGKGSSDSDAFSELGGSGSAGGDAGDVGVFVGTAVIKTSGDDADGISANSTGGGGGDSGTESGVVSMGGSAGNGGDGGNVTVSLAGTSIVTEGYSADGLYAASTGGGGGKASSTSGIATIGGSGGDGGDAGDVSLYAAEGAAVIVTSGMESSGIYLQSVGGGGGKGGNVQDISVDFTHAIGGSGGSGGAGGNVTASDDGSDYDIFTLGDNAFGFYAQSVGGGGGHGGNSLSVSADVAIGISLGDGGDGAGGGDSGIVDISVDGTIQTGGDNAAAVFAQSLGGGGGSSGSTTSIDAGVTIGDFSNAVGGNAGDGGDAKGVVVSSNSDIVTGGSNASGLVAISQGGGGGHSGHVLSADTGASVTSINLSTGGTAGSGGSGDSVSVTHSGSISTNGDNSDGLFAQSLGGGGGNGGTVISGSSISASSVSLAVGSTGGSGGDASTVYVDAATDIATEGHQSTAIFAQSLGGGGGNSGTTISSTLTGVASIDLALGQDGGGGGSSADVTVNSTGGLTTYGSGAYGIYAQSTGGNGGKAGLTIAADAIDIGNVTVGIGGDGGGGGNATGAVTVANTGDIATYGSVSGAIYAHSQGGGGGNSTGVIDSSGASMGDVTVSLAGGGGTGGNGGDVHVTNFGALQTNGSQSNALLAQSTGGTGGNGGYAIYGGLSGGVYSGNASFTLGGSGGTGGAAGDVRVINAGTITTSDYQSNGIFAESLGGAGGNGGVAISGSVDLATSGTVSVNVALGGSGGSGNAAGDVEVDNSAAIATFGNYSDAIFAHSVGGSGGSGGTAYLANMSGADSGTVSIDVAVGGSGGGSGIGGDIVVANTGALATYFSGSNAIYAQSIGGDGGNGGSAGTILFSDTTGTGGTSSVAANVAVGGTGGTGANAGAVEVGNSGNITTYSGTSDGIFAQSIGGGGGDGGDSSAFTFAEQNDAGSGSSNKTASLTFSLGGSGESGGDGSTVDVANSGSIRTSGQSSYGIYAQSIGGGGGNGGDGSDTLDVWTDNETLDDIVDTLVELNELREIISEIEDKEWSSFLEDWEIIVGGSGGSGGNSDKVTVLNSGNITKTGDDGAAIFSQSIGGGGGSGGDGEGGIATKLTLGGQGASGGNGADVEVVNSGAITLTGSGTMGIFAQSVGGGGGAAGDVELAFAFDDSSWSGFGVGVVASESAGGGGDGKDVTVTSSGAIVTTGENSHAILAQSVGGGGGAYGIGTTVALDVAWGSNGAYGDGGDVTVNVDGSIAVTGENSVAVFAQSVSGADTAPDTDGVDPVYTYDGDGNYDSGEISIVVSANIYAAGDSANGIVAQSDGHTSAGAIQVDIDAGATVYASEQADDLVTIIDGDANTLEVNGSLVKEEGDSLNGYVITTVSTDTSSSVIETSNDLTIDNYGTVSGSISLYEKAENNIFNNQEGAVFNMGLEVDFGNTNGQLNNDGTLSPGGEDSIIDSTFSGTLTQSSTGSYQVDLSMGDGTSDADADQILGDATPVSMAGDVLVNATGDNLLISGESGSTYILQVGGSTISSFTAEAVDTAVVDYSVATATNTDTVTIDGKSFSSTSAVELSYTIDFSAGGSDILSSNGLVFGAFMDDLVDYTRTNLAEGSLAREVIQALTNYILNAEDAGALEAIYDEQIVSEAASAVSMAVSSAHRTHNLLQSCPVLERDPKSRFYRQQDCAWTQVLGSYSNQDQTGNNPGYYTRTFGMAVGAQREIADRLFLEVAGSYEQIYVDGSNFDQDGFQLGLGAVLKKELDPFVVTGTFSAGAYDLDYDRRYTITSSTSTASSQIRGRYLGGELRAYSVLANDGFYAKPSAAVSIVQTWQDGFTESGIGGLEWRVDDITQTTVAVRPSLELGAAFDLGENPANAFIRAGVTAFVTDPDTNVTSYLANEAFSGLRGLETELTGDRFIGELDAGMNVDLTDRLSLSVLAQSTFSENSLSAGGYGRLKFQF